MMNISERLVHIEQQGWTPLCAALAENLDFTKAIEMVASQGSPFFRLNTYWHLAWHALNQQKEAASSGNPAPESLEGFGLELLRGLDPGILCVASSSTPPPVLDTPFPFGVMETSEYNMVFMTARLGWARALEMWLDAGADLMASTVHPDLETPVLAGVVSSPCGSTAVLDLALSRGLLSPDFRTTIGGDWLQLASQGERDPHMFQQKVLNAKLGSLHHRDERGQTALHYAATKNTDLAAVVWLLSHHVEVDARDNLGETALHKAAAADLSEHCKLLLEAGADPNAANNEKQTPPACFPDPENLHYWATAIRGALR